MKLNLNRLAELKEEARQHIDAGAEKLRLQFITPGDGQQMAYKQKEEEAQMFLANPTLTATEVPHIFAEVGITGATPTEVATTILALRDQWKNVSALIEATRLSAKQAVTLATTAEEVVTAANINWNTLLTP